MLNVKSRPSGKRRTMDVVVGGEKRPTILSSLSDAKQSNQERQDTTLSLEDTTVSDSFVSQQSELD